LLPRVPSEFSLLHPRRTPWQFRQIDSLILPRKHSRSPLWVEMQIFVVDQQQRALQFGSIRNEPQLALIDQAWRADA
jgi:hypothetical protein